MKLLAIPQSNQKTVAEWLVIAIPLGRQTALHSQSTKPANTLASRWLALHSQSTKPANTLASRWLAPTKWLVMIKLLGFIAGITLSATLSAMGMGGINVTSGLGQVLTADIELVAVNKADKASLVARLASPDIYKSAGLEYPYGNKFKFQIESRANGEPYLKVTSAQPINDPFVVMLVELTWSSGRLLREYTFLLDPPGYVAELPAQAKVQPLAPAVQAATEGAAAIPVEPTAQPQVIEGVSGMAAASEPASVTAPVPVPASEPPAEAAPETPAESVTESTAMGEIAEQNEEWLAVQRGDTLSKISALYKPADVSLERMLVALYRANASQFDAKNMNRIRAGKILRMPSQKEVDVVGQSEAVKEIHAQVADWNAYRQKLASAAAQRSQPQATEQVATGKLASSVADKAPVAKESAKEVLKLSRGEAPGDQTATGAGGKSMTAQDRKNAAQEEAIAKAKAEKEEHTRTAMLEKNLQDMQRLAQLKSSAAALAQQPKAPASAVAAASEVKPAPVAKPKPKPVPVKQEPSLVDQMMAMLDQIMAEPLYLAGGVGALVGLGGVGWLLNRRKKKSFDVIGQFSEPAVASPDTGDFTGISSPQAEAGEQSSEADPISEADLFLNFGRDAQAEEILKDALQSTPNNHKIHLKLLEIYASRKDLSSFETIARQLQDSGDEEASQQALAMGRELDPNNPMYGGTTSESGSASVQTPTFDTKPKLVKGDTSTAKAKSVDFDLGGGPAKSAPSPEDDFLSGAFKTVAMSSAAKSAPSPEDDFLSGALNTLAMTSSSNPSAQQTGEREKSALPDLGDLIFDVTGKNPSASAAEETAVPLPDLEDMTLNLDNQPSASATQAETDMPQVEEGVMEFTLDFPGEEKTEKSASSAKPSEAGFAGINLNFDDTLAPAAPSSDSKDDHWQEVATKLDLAKAYQEMGDASGAREIIEEVLREGDTEQRDAAQSLLAQLG
ncbi:MAG: FimV/HubP family polar landmark protein [Gallionella sp.]